ncbi:MAG: hypothetical protein ACFB4J_11385 [Elainellaceae cyanobacterium]
MIKVAAALKFWLVFLLLFRLAGFTAVQSIFLGGLAGWTGGLLSKWWSIKAVIDEDEEEPLLKPITLIARFLSSGTLGRTSAERHQANRKAKPSPGWFGPFGPPNRRR